MTEDFIEFNKYYREAVKSVPDDSFFKESINHKYRHSVEVLRAGELIMQETDELKNLSEDLKKYAQKALLFHDVGRFEEAVLRYNTPHLEANSEVLNRYDHGLIGYNTMRQNPLYNDIRILLAIRYHGKMMDDVKKSALWAEAEQSPQADAAKKILYLVRDADKLANLAKIKSDDHLRKDIFYKLLPDEAKYAGLSETVMRQFFAEQTILSATVYSFADRILQVISWIFDLNYRKTKEIFTQEKYGAYLLNLMPEYNVSADEIKQISEFTDKKSGGK